MTNLTLTTIAVAGLLALSANAYADEDKTITVYKTPWCGCCKTWADAVEKAGYHVVVEEMEDLSTLKKQAGVPDDMQACHTAVIGDKRKYVIEGHVPLEAIDKMMTERPDIRGIAVPGMPQGSLGMGYDPKAEYTVYAIGSKLSNSPQSYMMTGR